MAQAVAAQMATAGDACTLRGPASRPDEVACTAVVTSRGGDYVAEVGGAEVQVTGHALISKAGLTRAPRPADTLQVTGGTDVWQLVSAVSSDNDAAWSCNMVRVS